MTKLLKNLKNIISRFCSCFIKWNKTLTKMNFIDSTGAKCSSNLLNREKVNLNIMLITATEWLIQNYKIDKYNDKSIQIKKKKNHCGYCSCFIK